jgi:hypothetical protein
MLIVGEFMSLSFISSSLAHIYTIYYVKKKVASTVLFTRIVSGMTFITYGQATALLTLVTLFLGELLPKALGVSKAETVSHIYSKSSSINLFQCQIYRVTKCEKGENVKTGLSLSLLNVCHHNLIVLNVEYVFVFV